MMSRPIANAFKSVGGAVSCLAAAGLGVAAISSRSLLSTPSLSSSHIHSHHGPAPAVTTAVATALFPTAVCDGNVPLAGMRREYRDSARVELNDAEIGTDPLPLFQKWLEEVGRLGLHFTPLRLKYVYAATGH